MRLCLEMSHHIEKLVGVLGLSVVSLLDVHSFVANIRMGAIGALGPIGATGHSLPFVVRVVLQGGRVGVPPRRDRMDFANPTFEQMARH
jgi:hypothetical protein